LAAYLIYTRRELLDPEKNRLYAQQVGPVLQQFDGEVVAVGAATETLEGNLIFPLSR